MDEVTAFYVDGLGFERLASFEDHAGFDGDILGSPGAPYHLEFTHQRHAQGFPAPHPDTLLVFYLPDQADWRAAVARLRTFGTAPVASQNPYWDRVGLTFVDPDGFRIVLQQDAWRL